MDPRSRPDAGARTFTLVLTLLSLITLPPAVDGQEERPVSLDEAVTEAMDESPDVRAARSRAEAAEHGERAADAFRWPMLSLEAGAVRSNDPVAAFGARLRQGRFTAADFDPARLNHPDPITDWSGAVALGWSPLDFSALAESEAAELEATAAGLGATWAARAAGFRAEARYVEAVAADNRLRAARSAEEAARANLEVTEQRREEGVLTDADVLQARAALSGAEARRIDAERSRADARSRLAVAMGWSEDAVPIPTDTVLSVSGDPGGGAPAAAGSDLAERPDLRASGVQVEAEEARARQARRARLPTLETFARIETHSAQVAEDLEDDWTLGFQLRVPLFTGFGIGAREDAATALRDAAAREHEQRLREARAQVSEVRRAVESAARSAEAARAAADAAEEAARLTRRRFEEGLTTTADLLAVEARAADLRIQAVNAELMRYLARARLEFLTDTNIEDEPRGGTNP